jgi:putative ABC transport system ATP-binding protein
MSGLRLVGVRPLLLEPVDLAIDSGELVFLSGPSGSGKSLLLRAVADLDPHEGEVWLDGVARSSLGAPEWRRRVGMLPAESHWWGEKVSDHFPSVWRRSGVAGSSEDLGSDDVDAVNVSLLGLLQQLGFGADALDWSVARLSTGERQRLALARLLAVGPQAFLLDEATANLDPPNRDRVEAIIEDYRARRGAAVLWVSHDAEQRRRLGGRRLIIRDARLEAEP